MELFLKTISLAELLLLSGLRSEAFRQRAANDAVALALGREVPSAQGRYLLLDVLAMGFVDQIADHLGVSRKEAAVLVRLHWKLWLSLVQRAEWDQKNGWFIYLAVGWFRYLDIELPPPPHSDIGTLSGLEPGSPIAYPGLVVWGGLINEITEAAERKQQQCEGLLQSLTTINVRCMVMAPVLARAAKNGIKLPPRYTAEPDSDLHGQMVGEIRGYRLLSERRLCAKGRRPTPAPKNMHRSMPEGV